MSSFFASSILGLFLGFSASYFLLAIDLFTIYMSQQMLAATVLHSRCFFAEFNSNFEAEHKQIFNAELNAFLIPMQHTEADAEFIPI